MHEVAQDINPAARVAYIDNDPIVHSHARALLANSSQGTCAYVQANLREPEKIIGSPPVHGTLDFDRPVALILAAAADQLESLREQLPGRAPSRMTRRR
ncbi:MAG: SAM-dependent methyltransferase [Trebonia sp.]